MDVKCPHCKSVVTIDDHMVLSGPRLASGVHECSACGEYFTAHFKVRFLGCSTHGCNLYPADGETEESMMAAGVELDD